VTETADIGGAAECTAASPLEDFATAEAGLQRQQRLAEFITPQRRRLLLLWRAPQALLVCRGNTRLPGFSAAAERLRVEGWPVLLRRSGGSACPIAPGTLQIAIAQATAPDFTMERGYDELAGLILTALRSFGLAAEIGAVPDAFCPGRYDIAIGGRKIAGLSQHWRSCSGVMTATTAAALIVTHDTAPLARIVNLFYEIAGGAGHCTDAAVSAVREHLPADAATHDELMQDLGARMTDIWREQSASHR
jgi:lipoate-protein ligase A